VQRLNHEDVAIAHVHQWPDLVLAIFEVSLFVITQGGSQVTCDLLAIGAPAIEAEEMQS
jgi:hypothetical protein